MRSADNIASSPTTKKNMGVRVRDNLDKTVDKGERKYNTVRVPYEKPFIEGSKPKRLTWKRATD